MFYLAGIFITFFLSVLLASKKGKSAADKILTAWLIVIGIHLTLFYIYATGNYENFAWLLGLGLPLPLVHGPFLFLYTTALMQQRKIRHIGWLHFLPVAVVYILEIPFFLLTNVEKVLVYKNKGEGYHWLTDTIVIANIASGIIYVMLSFLNLRKHKANIENQFSNTAKINLNWLRYLIYGISVIWIVIIVDLGDEYIFATVVIFVFFIGYFGIKQVGIFSNTSSSNLITEMPVENNIQVTQENEPVHVAKEEPNESLVKIKYQKSSLSDEYAAQLHEQLQQLMLKEKLFTNPELNLGELAGRLNIHSNVLSQVINSFEKKTFYDYINGLRIEQFKHLVTHPDSQQYTLLSLAFDCGFNSKTAFNRNFKKATGLSPSEYLNQVKVNLA